MPSAASVTPASASGHTRERGSGSSPPRTGRRRTGSRRSKFRMPSMGRLAAPPAGSGLEDKPAGGGAGAETAQRVGHAGQRQPLGDQRADQSGVGQPGQLGVAGDDRL